MMEEIEVDPKEKIQESTFSSSCKDTIFHVFFTLVIRCSMPMSLYCVLSLLELTQVFGYLLEVKVQNFGEGTSEVIKEANSFIQSYISLVNITTVSFVTFVVMLSLGFALICCMIYACIHEYMNISVSSFDGNGNCFHSFLGCFLIIYRKICFFPFSVLLFMIISCKGLSETMNCNTNLYFSALSVGIFIFLWVCVICVLAAWFLVDESPDSRVPWALRQIQLEFISLIKIEIAALGFTLANEKMTSIKSEYQVF